MQHEYRGHRIRLIQAERWSAELVELASGTVLPTMVVAGPEDSVRDVSAQARKLVDVYLEAQARTRHWVAGPVRPWQIILS